VWFQPWLAEVDVTMFLELARVFGIELGMARRWNRW